MKSRHELIVLISLIAVAICAAAQELPRIELGVQYSAISIPSDRIGCGGCKVYNHGFGGRFVANFNRVLSFDSEFDFFPDAGSGATNLDGGRVTTGLFGVKGGYRIKRFGVFAKVRPGFQTYGHAITSVASTTPLQFNYVRRVNFALDIGGVLEYYATRRLALRFDLGDTRIRFDTGTTHVWGNNLQLGTGVVFRF
jgi:Outer membrane protein beta-barrel domain